MLDETKEPLSCKLGKALFRQQLKIPDMVAQWAKRGKEPISKMEFRVNVRKIFSDDVNVKDIDALFASWTTTTAARSTSASSQAL